MYELYDTTHYLKLAYLAEASIVFNLAYLELKQKKNFQELAKKMSSPESASLVLTPDFTNSICKKKGCYKCKDGDTLLSKFEKIDIDYIAKMGRELNSDQISEYKNGQDNASKNKWRRFCLLYDAWSNAKFKLRYLLLLFHIIVRKNLDRQISITSLVLTVVVLIVLSMADSNVYFYRSFFAKFGLWSSSDEWMFWLWYILTIFIVMPGIFWSAWSTLLNEYECLSILLAEVYQKKSKGGLEDYVRKITG